MTHHMLTVPGQIGRESLAEYVSRGGYRWLGRLEGTEILALLRRAGLRGRGGSGSGYPVAQKWAKVMKGRSGTRYVVANGAETSPGSKKDRFLMEHHPHRILDGALAAAQSVGAALIYLYVKATAEQARISMERAVEELQASDFAGHLPAFELFRAPETAVAGEETAVCDAIEGFTGQPQVKPPTPETAGIRGRPTLVSNVETFAAAAAVLRDGPERFRSAGTEVAPGTILVTLSGDINHPGVYEVPLGISIRTLLEDYGGGAQSPVVAVLPGGFHSGPLGPDELDLPLEYDSLLEAGTTLGLSHVVVLARPNTLADLMTGAMELGAAGSCRQCAICAEGTATLRGLVGQLAAGSDPAPIRDEIAHLTHIFHGKGNCGYLTGVSLMVRRAALRFPSWREEVTTHGRDR